MKKIIPTFEEYLKEDSFSFPAASPQNTPGQGNVNMPSYGSVGSGDKFDNEYEKRRKNRKRRKKRIEPLEDTTTSRDLNRNG